MSYLLPVSFFAISFGDEACNSIVYTGISDTIGFGPGEPVAFPTGNIS